MKAEQRKSGWWAVPLIVLIVLAVAVASWLRAPPPKPDVPQVELVHEVDANLQRAANEARQKLPEFRDRLQSAQPGERFAIRARFETSAGPEFLWLKDPIYSEGSYQGVLDQEPVALDAKKGDPLTVAEDQVYDWMIIGIDSTEGAFTEQALRDRR